MTRDRRNEIADRAYDIWEREGRPHGKALDHWLRAETELQGARQEAAPLAQTSHQPEPPREQAPAKRSGPRARRRMRTGQPPTKGGQ